MLTLAPGVYNIKLIHKRSIVVRSTGGQDRLQCAGNSVSQPIQISGGNISILLE